MKNNRIYKCGKSMNSMKKMDKKGQLTLFIILALLLAVAIGILLYFWNPEIFRFGRFQQPSLENCLQGSLDDKIQTLSLSAGLINPNFNYLYQGNNYTYLCYTNEYYQPCVNQHPFLVKTFEDSLTVLIAREFQSCYDSSVDDLRRRGFEVEEGSITFNISIEPNEIRVEIDAPMTITLEDSAISTRKYTYRHRTNLYELLMVATSLIQFETYYGDAEQLDHMLLYPDIVIRKERRDDDSKVYSLTEINEDIEYRFAVRSRPWPPGGMGL
jgi:hypothetical protein